MALILKENVQVVVVGDGESTSVKVDLAAAPVRMSFERRFPDRATVSINNRIVESVLKESVVSFSFQTPPLPNSGNVVTVALEYDV